VVDEYLSAFTLKLAAFIVLIANDYFMYLFSKTNFWDIFIFIFFEELSVCDG